LICFIAGIIALLDEDDDRIKSYGLNQLNKLVDVFWAEIADSITNM
jgi:26S proteasome regulatory subunit N2